MVEIQKPPQNIEPALYNYLYQLAEVLSLRMNEVNQKVTVAVEAAKTGGSEKLTDGKSSEYQALKSLIIKTADVVKIKETVEGALAELDALETRLTKEYVASSQFGEYLEQINATISPESEHSPYSRRLHSHRLQSLQLELSMDKDARQTVHSLRIEAR